MVITMLVKARKGTDNKTYSSAINCNAIQSTVYYMIIRKCTHCIVYTLNQSGRFKFPHPISDPCVDPVLVRTIRDKTPHSTVEKLDRAAVTF